MDVVVTMGRWTPRAVALESNASIGSSSVGVGGVVDGVWGCPAGGSVVVVLAAVFVFVVVGSGVGVDGSVSSDPCRWESDRGPSSRLAILGSPDGLHPASPPAAMSWSMISFALDAANVVVAGEDANWE